MKRHFVHARDTPMEGDIVEIRERRSDDGESYDCEAMLRVLAVREDFVWFKEYGEGRKTAHIKEWRRRLSSARLGTLIRGGDHDAPF